MLDKKELKQLKLCREFSLFERRDNITNNVGTHKCSAYCLKIFRRLCKFDHNEHGDINENDKHIESDNVQTINIIDKDFRMIFGKPLPSVNSGETNITREIPI